MIIQKQHEDSKKKVENDEMLIFYMIDVSWTLKGPTMKLD